jgi:hypothetical protein
MDRELTIAFLTPSIHGHSNVHLTILRRFLSVKPEGVSRLALHVIGDEPLRSRLASLPTPAAHCTFAFHTMGTRDYLEDTVNPDRLKKPPGSLKVYRDLMRVMNREPKEYLGRYAKIVEVLESVRPDIVIVDMIYRALGVDACRTAGADWVILSPGPSLDFCSLTQPHARGLWYYPVCVSSSPMCSDIHALYLYRFASSIPFPVPWHLIPMNLVLNLYLIFQIIASPYAKRLNAARNAAGLAGTAVAPMSEGTRVVIHASLPEVEYPHIPGPGTVFAGPIFERVPPISSKDYSELTRFLDGGRTVLINLGSLFQYTEEEVNAMATAILMARERLQGSGGFRVLWKLPKASSFSQVLEQHFGLGSEDTFVWEWIDAPSLAVLQHPNLAASVHHGGASEHMRVVR